MKFTRRDKYYLEADQGYTVRDRYSKTDVKRYYRVAKTRSNGETQYSSFNPEGQAINVKPTAEEAIEVCANHFEQWKKDNVNESTK